MSEGFYIAKNNGNSYCKGRPHKLCHFFLGSAIRLYWPGQKMFYYHCSHCGLIHLTKKKKGVRYQRLPAYP